MDVRVGLAAHHGRYLSSRRSHRHEFRTNKIRNILNEPWCPRPAHHDAQPPVSLVAAGRRRAGRGQYLSLRRERDRARDQIAGPAAGAPFPQGYVDGPVGAPWFAELPGAVERVDDPYPVRGEPRGIIGALLGQDHVAGAAVSERGDQELVR